MRAATTAEPNLCCLYFSTNATDIRSRLEKSNPSDYANMCITCSDISYSFCTHCKMKSCVLSVPVKMRAVFVTSDTAYHAVKSMGLKRR